MPSNRIRSLGPAAKYSGYRLRRFSMGSRLRGNDGYAASASPNKYRCASKPVIAAAGIGRAIR
jgi:hypothetical protein